MNEFKGTPGPWKAGEFDEYLGYDCMTAGVRAGPAVLDGRDYGQKPCTEIEAAAKARMLADASLIVTAPDLLKALKLAREYVADELNCRRAAFAGHEAVGCVQDVERDLDIIDAAIAKALGNQEVTK